MAVKIVIPGALTTVQDRGRYGYQAFGIQVSGAMDLESYEAANALVGNQDGEAALELTLFGGTMEFTEDVVAALTGADMEPVVDGMPVSMNRPFQIRAGQVLTLGMAKTGCRTYLAVSGGIDVPIVMGSRSTNMKCCIGGLEGRALKAGDLLPIGKTQITFDQIKDRKAEPLQTEALLRLAVVEGPQEEYFTEKGKEDFYREVYTISEQSDRMGYRMDGMAVESKAGADIISDGIAFGSIQITAAGQPIVLMADRQTTGGYAKIGTVCSFDLPKLAQGKPGDRVQFYKMSVQEAQTIDRKKGSSHGLH